MAAVYKSKVLYAKKSSSVFATNVFKKSLNRVKIMQILVARLLPYMFRLLNIVRFQIRMKILFYQQIPDSSVL